MDLHLCLPDMTGPFRRRNNNFALNFVTFRVCIVKEIKTILLEWDYGILT